MTDDFEEMRRDSTYGIPFDVLIAHADRVTMQLRWGWIVGSILFAIGLRPRYDDA